MSAIVGVLRLDDLPLDSGLVPRMAQALAHRGRDGINSWCQVEVGLGHCMLWTTPESLHERQPLVTNRGAFALVADARIDNRAELIRALELDREDPERPITDADLILAAYRTWGEGCPQRLIGDFAFAIWDRDQRRLFCTRDHMGVRSLYYYHGRGCFAFATELKALFELEEVSRQIDERMMADYLSFDFRDLERTFYAAIRRLPPAHRLTVDSRSLQTGRYWALEPQRRLLLSSDREYEEAFREVFTESVRCRLRSAFAVGSALSGGLDSSSICCAARQILSTSNGEKLHTFSCVFPSLSASELRRIDERRYIEAVVAEGDLLDHQVRADLLSPLDDLETTLWHQEGPCVPFNLYLHLGLYRAASEASVRIFLDGLDGDSTVSHGFGRLADLATSLRWPTLLKEVRDVVSGSRNPNITFLTVIQAYVIRPLLLPTAGRLRKLLRRRRVDGSDPQALVSRELARRAGLGSRDRPDRSQSTTRLSKSRQDHLESLESPLLVWALESADKAAGAWSVEPRYPFFDRRLMEFCLSLPADQKLRDGWARSILRRAMDGLLPREIQWRYGKADLSPNFLRRLRAPEGGLSSSFVADHRETLAGFVEADRLSDIHQRWLQGGTQSEAMRLFTAATLARWLHETPGETASGARG